MQLQNNVDLLLLRHDINGLNHLLAKASPRLTFWGTRVVEVQGIDGSVKLHSLIERSLVLLRNVPSPEAHSLRTKLSDFLTQTDAQIDSANCITKIFNFIYDCMQAIRWGKIRWTEELPYDEIRGQTSYPRIFSSQHPEREPPNPPRPQTPYSRIFGS